MNSAEYVKLKQALADLPPDQHIFFDDRVTLGRYQAAIAALVEAGLAETEFVDMPEEQYAKLIVRSKRQP